jgi:serine phosphatase RsbU (regulator of sigma subunit)/Flp pilus assembly protein TadD
MFSQTCFAQSKQDSLLNELQTSTDSLKTHIYNDLAYIYMDSSGVRAINFSQKAISLAKKFNQTSELSYAYIMLGSAYMTKSDYANAITNFNNAIQSAEKVKNFDQLHSIYNNLGIIYRNTNELELALEYYSKALYYASKSDNIECSIQTYCNIGNIYTVKKEYSKSLDFYNLALDECKKSPTFRQEIAGIYNNIGYVNFVENNYTDALESYNKAYYYYDSLKQIEGKAVLLNNIAEIKIIQKKYQEAEKCIQEADSLHKLMDLNDSRKNLYYTAYELYFQSGQFEIAINYLNKYQCLKDSIYTKELAKQTKEISTKFEVDKITLQKSTQDLKIKQQNLINIALLVVIAIFLVLVILLIIQSYTKSKLNKLLVQTNKIIENKNFEINENLSYARMIQESCMKSNSQNISFKYFTLDLPKFTVGGDFYIVIQKENRTYFAIADCTGHGIAGGFLSVLGIQLLSFAIENYKNLNDIINYLNISFYNYFTVSDTLTNESLCLSLIYIENNTVFYTGSKQKIWKYSDELREIIEYKTSSESIGIKEHSAFLVNSFEVKKGDTIYLSSDGYPDQFGGSDKRKLKYEKFRHLLAECSTLNIQEQKSFLQKKHKSWKNNEDQTDDILLIGIKI